MTTRDYQGDSLGSNHDKDGRVKKGRLIISVSKEANSKNTDDSEQGYVHRNSRG